MDTVRLLSPQAQIVWDVVERDGTAFSRRAYVKKKYEECAQIFLSAYDAYVREAEKYVPKPEGAEYPYWAFASARELDASAGGRVMVLDVPLDEVVFFDRFEWYTVLRLDYLAAAPEEDEKFRRNLKMRGVKEVSDVVLTPYYPDLKRQVIGSWKNLFRFHEAIRSGDTSVVRAVQAGLWRIKKEWLTE